MSFDEHVNDDPHSQCWDEIEHLRRLIGHSYQKLLKFGVEVSDPMLIDELKLVLMDGYHAPTSLAPVPELSPLRGVHGSALVELKAGYEAQLAASQAREYVLRSALLYGDTSNLAKAVVLPVDDTALRQYVAGVLREIEGNADGFVHVSHLRRKADELEGK